MKVSPHSERRTAIAFISVALLVITAGCVGISPDSLEISDSPEKERTSTEKVNTTPEDSTGDGSGTGSEWNATVDIHTFKTSLASENYVFNGWNVSIEVTSVDGAEEIIYVYEAVNVEQGNATREGVVSTGESGTTSTLSLLQRNETVTVYAVKGGERKQIGFVEITSSYVAPWDSDRGWDDSWRGEHPSET